MTGLKDNELPEALPLDRPRAEQQPSPLRPKFRPAPATRAVETVSDIEPLPRTIGGGFLGLANDLESRSREWVVMHRLLEQSRLALESAELERDRLYDKLNATLPQVQNSLQSLASAVEVSKSGDLSGELTTHFAANMGALDELERVSTALTNNFLVYRSAWEQYARGVIRAQRMREEG